MLLNQTIYYFETSFRNYFYKYLKVGKFMSKLKSLCEQM